MIFLKAHWQNLILINYKIKPEILHPFVPNYTKLDLYNGDCYVSLVGFMFKNTKVLGIKIPYHVNFEEVNLRFYVKKKEGSTWKRGVVFIKEIVPKRAITCIANTLYHEHYQTLPMQHSWTNHKNEQTITYQWKNDTWQSIQVTASATPNIINENSEEEFITEHYFGYTKYKNKTFEYEVEHPKWVHFPVKNHIINIDFKLNYGDRFKLLNTTKPTSIILAKGSEINVKNKVLIQR